MIEKRCEWCEHYRMDYLPTHPLLLTALCIKEHEQFIAATCTDYSREPGSDDDKEDSNANKGK